MTWHVLLTRPIRGARAFAQHLMDAGVPRSQITLSPVVEIEAREAAIDLGGIDGVVITSGNAIAGLPKAAKTLPVYCVGQRTAARLEAQGFRPKRVGHDVAALITALRQDCRGARLLYLRGETVTTDLSLALDGASISVTEAIVYAQQRRELTTQARQLMGTAGDVILPMFSARSAGFLCSQILPHWPSRRVGLCISEQVRQAAEPRCFDRLEISERPDSDAMLKALLSFYPDSGA